MIEIKAARKRILWIEDDTTLRHIIETKFSKAAYDMTSVATGTEALDYLKEHVPDLIVLDLLLPGVDGFEVLKRVHAQTSLKDIPILVLSNLGGEEDISRAMQLGAKKYVVKAQTTPDALIEQIDILFS